MKSNIKVLPTSHFKELDKTKHENLYYIGNISLLERKKIGIVGTRRPSTYTKKFTYELASELTRYGSIVVSGTAMGVDIMAHRGAKAENTIAIVAHGVDIRYPKINSNDIKEIEEKGLVLSTYPPEFRARAYTFVQRNEIIAMFCDAIIISEAELKSGSLHTASFAIKHNKPIFVAPHRLYESAGTWELLKNNQASVIDDIELFAREMSGVSSNKSYRDEFLEYCKNNPRYDEVVKVYQEKLFEYELLGKIEIKNGIIFVK